MELWQRRSSGSIRGLDAGGKNRAQYEDHSAICTVVVALRPALTGSQARAMPMSPRSALIADSVIDDDGGAVALYRLFSNLEFTFR